MDTLNKFLSSAMAFAVTFTLSLPTALAQLPAAGANPDIRNENRIEKPSRWAGPRRHAGMGGRIFEQLDLTDAQKAQIQQIRATHREAISNLRREIRAKQQEIRLSSQGPTFNDTFVKEKLVDIAGLKTNLLAEMFKMKQEISATLTADQKSKLEQLHEEFKSKFQNRRLD